MIYKQSISVVVPIYNDSEVIHELIKRLSPVLESITADYEIILVDDGSRDDSWLQMLAVRQANASIKAVRLSRNFGQQSAIAAGLSLTSKELIVLMEKYYGIRLATASEAKPIFRNLATMAAYIAEHRTK